MRTTLTIDDDILEDARRIAQAEGTTVGAVISNLARRALAPAAVVEREGLPAFDVADDAPVITTRTVARALDDE